MDILENTEALGVFPEGPGCATHGVLGRHPGIGSIQRGVRSPHSNGDRFLAGLRILPESEEISFGPVAQGHVSGVRAGYQSDDFLSASREGSKDRSVVQTIGELCPGKEVPLTAGIVESSGTNHGSWGRPACTSTKVGVAREVQSNCAKAGFDLGSKLYAHPGGNMRAEMVGCQSQALSWKASETSSSVSGDYNGCKRTGLGRLHFGVPFRQNFGWPIIWWTSARWSGEQGLQRDRAIRDSTVGEDVGSHGVTEREACANTHRQHGRHVLREQGRWTFSGFVQRGTSPVGHVLEKGYIPFGGTSARGLERPGRCYQPQGNDACGLEIEAPVLQMVDKRISFSSDNRRICRAKQHVGQTFCFTIPSSRVSRSERIGVGVRKGASFLLPSYLAGGTTSVSAQGSTGSGIGGSSPQQGSVLVALASSGEPKDGNVGSGRCSASAVRNGLVFRPPNDGSSLLRRIVKDGGYPASLVQLV